MKNENLISKIIKECKNRLGKLEKDPNKESNKIISEMKVVTELLSFALKKQKELGEINNIVFLINNIVDADMSQLVQKNLYNSLIYNFITFAKEQNNIMNVIRENNTDLDKDIILKEDTGKEKVFSFKKILGKGGKVGTPYIFSFQNKDLIIKVSPGINMFSRNHTDVERYKCFKYYNIHHENCVPEMVTMKSISGNSEYVNETIIGFLLNYIFYPSYFKSEENLSIEGYPKINEDFCNSVFQIGYFQNENKKIGYNVMEKCDNTIDKLFNNAEELSKIKFFIGKKEIKNQDEIMLMLLQQINNTLEILKTEYAFNHGDLKGGNFFYKIDDEYLKVDYPLNGYIFFKEKKDGFFCNTNIRLKIADYGKCSITYNEVRFYCNDSKLKLHKLSQIYYDPEKLSLESLKDGEEYLFDTDTPHGIELALRHLACPYFLSADYYILLESLCLTSIPFCNFLDKYDILKVIKLDIDKEELKDIKNPESVSTSFKMLKGKYFKCTAIKDSSEKCLSYLKSI